MADRVHPSNHGKLAPPDIPDRRNRLAKAQRIKPADTNHKADALRRLAPAIASKSFVVRVQSHNVSLEAFGRTLTGTSIRTNSDVRLRDLKAIVHTKHNNLAGIFYG